MVAFSLIAGALALMAAFILARPLLRRAAPPPDAALHGQAVYRDQLEEVERDLERGLLSPEEAMAARAEIGRRMLAAGRAAAAAGAASAAPPMRALAALALAAPLAAVALYALLGRPGAPDRPLAPRLEAGETRAPGMTVELEAALAQFSDRLRRNPDDFEARMMLARVFYRTGQYNEALPHYRRALELEPDDTALMGEYAQARVMAGQGTVDSEALDLFRRIFEADPRNPEARFFLGVALADAGQYALARRLWEDLLADSPPDAPWVRPLREQLASLPDLPDDSIAPEPPLESADPAPQPQ